MNGNLKKDFAYVLTLAHPASVFGRRALKSLCPFEDKTALQEELNNVARLAEYAANNDTRFVADLLMPFKDIRRSLERLPSALTQVEMYEIKCCLLSYERAREPLCKLVDDAKLSGIALPDLTAPLDILDPERQRVASFYIEDSFADGLREAREQKLNAERLLRQSETAEQRERREEAVRKELQLEQLAMRRLSIRLTEYSEKLSCAIESLARLDITLQKSLIANKYGCVMPVISNDGIRLTDAVNPRYADINRHFTPISIDAPRGSTVITGANMGGKSVALATVALQAELIRHGFFPFATECVCELYGEVIAIFGDLADAERGLSSFGGEINAVKMTTEHIAQTNCLVAIDELAKGTTAREGAAIAAAVTEFLNNRDCTAVITTHYPDVARTASKHYRVAGIDTDGTMRYGLMLSDGSDDEGDAVRICESFGIDETIINRAKQILAERNGK